MNRTEIIMVWLLSHGLLFPISSMGYFIRTIPNWIVLVGMRNNWMGLPWEIDLLTHCTMHRCSITEQHLAPFQSGKSPVYISYSFVYAYTEKYNKTCTTSTLWNIHLHVSKSQKQTRGPTHTALTADPG